MKKFFLNKRVLISLGTIALVAVFAVASTSAFFSDTEVSEGNQFTSGAIDLTVDSECTYNGDASAECGTWDATDLTYEKFFNFTDVKPGDFGENTISLHVDSNDAYGCLMIDHMTNDDLGLTEPEAKVDTTDGIGNGELAEEISFFAWADDGDNIWEYDELPLFSNTYGPASDVLNGRSYPLGMLPGGETTYMGIYWCYGDMFVDMDGFELSCNGSAVTNASQTDQLTADIWFYIEQARNNEEFTCPAPNPSERTVLQLENKVELDDGTWVPTGNANGELTYITSNDTFNYTLEVMGLNPSTEYTLYYYADPWPSTNGFAIGTPFMPNASGYANVNGNVELGMSLPVAADANIASGAKIWVVPTSGTSFSPWTPTEYLMEMNFITYTDL
ncbi:MAG: SipW-dependent-type signal peptide-containing protein [Candidatus Kerfeldbacteria bacterium]|jgi:predicted ribosomally synthesized peptide with SipW-like signal peptide